MILSLVLAQAAPVPAPPAPAVPAQPDDVVVIGERLKAWRGKVSTTFGITTCHTVVSTGDRAIDAVGCTALKDCWSQDRAAYAAALHARDAGETRRIEGELGQCLKARRDALVDGLVQRRQAAGRAS